MPQTDGQADDDESLSSMKLVQCEGRAAERV